MTHLTETVPRGLPGSHRSYWMETAPAPAHPPLSRDIEVDVAVVGGGIAGLCTAWELARRGRSVAVLEADRIAAGVTGHTTAKLTALHTLCYDRIRRTRGPEGARLYAQSQQDAVEHAVAVAAELGVDCDMERLPAYTYVLDPGREGEVRAEAEAAREAGLPASYVRRTGLPFPVAAAVQVEDQAQFHPRAYLLGLAVDLLARGGVIHEQTRVTGLDERTPCRVSTEAGPTVTAGDVVVATHYPVFDRALLFTRLSPHRELVVAGPIPADLDPAGMYITPDQHKRSVRTAPHGTADGGERLLIVTGESFLPGTADVPDRFRRLADWAEQYFPDVRLTHRWAAQDNDPTDTVACVGGLHPGARHVYVATGFGGWGMSGGIMAGRLLASRITGEKLPWAGLYDPQRLRATVREAPAFVKHQTVTARHFLGDRLQPADVGSPEEIAPGAGAIVRVGGRRCAVHRDDEGTLHAVSASCTHLGCVVAYNAAERTWECPCHGSRFGVDGEVLQGPANRPLEQRELE